MEANIKNVPSAELSLKKKLFSVIVTIILKAIGYWTRQPFVQKKAADTRNVQYVKPFWQQKAFLQPMEHMNIKAITVLIAA